MSDRYCLKIEVMPDGSRLRYLQAERGSVLDLLSLPVDRTAPAVHITCTKFPGDTRLEIARKQLVELLKAWRRDALEVIVVDHRKAVQEVTLPSGVVLKRDSNLLLLVKAFQQWQRGETILAEDDAQALKVWIGDRAPFGMDAIESIKDMTALDDLESI
jgi:hypothetical protein